MLRETLAAAIAAFGFFFKELSTVLGQPRLVMSLVLGPFLIMLLFGLGYRGPQPRLRTILVLPDDPAIAGKVDVYDLYRQGLAGVFQLEKVAHDEDQAIADIKADRADVAVIVPADVYQRLASGQRATLRVVYTETDPTSNAWLRYFTSVQTGELNRRILLDLLRQTKGPALAALDYTDAAGQELDRLAADLTRPDTASARQRIDDLLQATQQVPPDLGAAIDRLGGLTQRDEPSLVTLQRELLDVRADLDNQPVDDARRQVQRIRERVEQFQADARRLSNIPLETLVSPLAAEPDNLAPVEPTPVAFYAPAVLALLLQHMGVTLSALSSVRDRLLGSLELFRVSPISAASLLVGKSLGYALLLAGIAAGLTLALVRLLAVPLLGDPTVYALCVASTCFAAVGLGFALSTIAATESQAVQLSMIVLLASVFFGGFFLPTNLLYQWVLVVSYLLPVTYGTIDLRDVMLRGAVPPTVFLAAPWILGAAFYLCALFGLRHQMRRA
jgi:ABC-2 type transport system permease protein